MESFIKNLSKKVKYNKKINKNESNILSLEINNWKEFKLIDIFKLSLGKPIHKMYIVDYISEGSTPYITRTAKNKGTELLLDSSNLIDKISKGNCITIGAEGLKSFYQKDDFLTGNKVNILRNKKINLYIALFLDTVLDFMVERKYTYGRAVVKNRLECEKITPFREGGERGRWIAGTADGRAGGGARPPRPARQQRRGALSSGEPCQASSRRYHGGRHSRRRPAALLLSCPDDGHLPSARAPPVLVRAISRVRGRQRDEARVRGRRDHRDGGRFRAPQRARRSRQHRDRDHARARLHRVPVGLADPRARDRAGHLPRRVHGLRADRTRLCRSHRDHHHEPDLDRNEVLSPTTEHVDSGNKWQHYQQIPSLREYVLVSQTQPRVAWYRRLPSGECEYREAAAGAVQLTSGVTLDLARLYSDLPD